MARRDLHPQPDLRLRLPAAELALLRRLAAPLLAAALIAGCTTPRPVQPTGSPTTTVPSATAAPSVAPTAAVDACAQPCRRRPRAVGSFPLRQAPEASGIAASRRLPDVLYVVDDGPGTTSVLAISATDGRALGRIEVEGLDGVDTEGLAVGGCSPRPGSCVYVGDIGDNVAGRDSIAVHRFAEPAEIDRRQVVPAERATLRYPDGPHDAEALLVDGGGTVGVVTKAAGRRKRGAARLYLTDAFGDAVLRDAGRVRVPLPAAPFATAVLGNVVTGGDWRRGAVVLRTYDAAFEYRAPSGRGGLGQFAAWPVTEVPAASEPQGEAIAYGADGCGLFTVSEGSGVLSAAPCR